MDSTSKIFDLFVSSNKIPLMIDFATRRRVYSWDGSSSLSEEDLRGTLDFDGFVDGYSGNRNRFRGTEVLEGPSNELEEIGVEVCAWMNDRHSREKYESQYELGSSVKGA